MIRLVKGIIKGFTILLAIIVTSPVIFLLFPPVSLSYLTMWGWGKENKEENFGFYIFFCFVYLILWFILIYLGIEYYNNNLIN